MNMPVPEIDALVHGSPRHPSLDHLLAADFEDHRYDPKQSGVIESSNASPLPELQDIQQPAQQNNDGNIHNHSFSNADASYRSVEPFNPDEGTVTPTTIFPQGSSLESHQRYLRAWRTSELQRNKKRLGGYMRQKTRHPYHSDNWRPIFWLLEKTTLVGEQHHRKILEIVKVPKNVHARFTADAGEVLLEIMLRTGSHLQVESTSGTHEEFEFTSLSLLGTQFQNTEALNLLPRFVEIYSPTGSYSSKGWHPYVLERRNKRTLKHHSLAVDSKQWAHQDGEDEELSDADLKSLETALGQVTKNDFVGSSIAESVRAVWAVDRRKHTSKIALPRRPMIGGALELSNYVRDLMSPIPKLARGALSHSVESQEPNDYFETVIEELISLLEDPGIILHMSKQILDQAFAFLVKHNQFPAAHQIYTKLAACGYAFHASNFNVLLAAAAKVGDVHNFEYALTLMLRRKIRPTATTWSAFHRLIHRRFPADANIVADAMRTRGLLSDPAAAKEVVQNSVEGDLTAHLAQQGSLASFLELYDTRYRFSRGHEGFEWLTVDVVNRMVKTFLAHGRMHDAYQVLETFQHREPKASLSTATLNTFLTSSLQASDPSTAIAVINWFRIGEEGALTPDHITFSILFNIAFKRRYFNMLRVVWRYACSMGLVERTMSHQIRKSLLSFAPGTVEEKGDEISRGQLWRTWAGKFAVGVADGITNSLPPLEKVADIETHAVRSKRAESTPPAIVANRSHPYQPLSEKAQKLIRMASEPPLAKGVDESITRRKKLQSLLIADLKQVMELKPVLPLSTLLARALQKDLEWKKKGFGHPKAFLTAEAESTMFAEMMADAIHVPMMKGNAAPAQRNRSMR